MKQPYSILAFAASNSSKSINKLLVDHTVKVLKSEFLSDVSVETIDINDYEMAIYSQDREAAGGIPQQAHNFFNKVKAADGVIISFAEHNGSYTAAYKNLFDWASRIDANVFQGNVALLMSTSPGPGGANSVLTAASNSFPFFGADVAASFSLGSFYEHFDADGNALSTPELQTGLKDALLAFSKSLETSG